MTFTKTAGARVCIEHRLRSNTSCRFVVLLLILKDSRLGIMERYPFLNYRGFSPLKATVAKEEPNWRQICDLVQTDCSVRFTRW